MERFSYKNKFEQYAIARGRASTLSKDEENEYSDVRESETNLTI